MGKNYFSLTHFVKMFVNTGSKFQKKIKCFSNAAEESILYVTIFILQTKAEFLQSNTHQ